MMMMIIVLFLSPRHLTAGYRVMFIYFFLYGLVAVVHADEWTADNDDAGAKQSNPKLYQISSRL